jgi:hypothetical protein
LAIYKSFSKCHYLLNLHINELSSKLWGGGGGGGRRRDSTSLTLPLSYCLYRCSYYSINIIIKITCK